MLGYRVPNQSSVWRIRWRVGNVSSDSQHSSVSGTISWVLGSLNISGVISFLGFNVLSIITHLVKSPWIVPVLQ